jgi:hypothetical protein
VAPVTIFSHSFPGIVWNTLAVEAENLLFIEVRDDVNFTVRFSVLDYAQPAFRWKDISLPENWWLSMTAASSEVLLLTRYLNKGNPDRKSLIAVDVTTHTIRWEVEDFSFFNLCTTHVVGYNTKDEFVEATIDLATGKLTNQPRQAVERQSAGERERPVFYAEGTPHFETIKKFVAATDFYIIKGVEYLELANWIVMSIYIDEADSLANYLLVFNRTGELVLKVKLGEKLVGLGADTFFILSGCLFLVKNKTELVAYRL